MCWTSQRFGAISKCAAMTDDASTKRVLRFAQDDKFGRH
jgi:hypothetical protein